METFTKKMMNIKSFKKKINAYKHFYYIIFYILLIITILFFFTLLGINLFGLITGLGIFSFGLGYALKDVISRTVNNILFKIYAPYKKGDYITVDARFSKFEGIVLNINLNYTIIYTPNKTLLYVPNNDMNNFQIFKRKKN